MTFEKALEAMEHGKKVFRPCWGSEPICYLSIQNVFGEKHLVIRIGDEQRNFNKIDDYYQIPFSDWEIYEEPKQEEPEMTAEKAIEVLRDIRKMEEYSYTRGLSITEFRHTIEFAIESLENQNQPKPEKKSKCEFNCKIQPAKFFPDDIPTLAFDTFTAGLKLGLEIAKDSQKENKNNAG